MSGPTASRMMRKLLGDATDQLVVPVQLRPSDGAAETRDVGRQAAIRQRQDIGLQRAEARGRGPPAACAGEVVVGTQFRHPHQAALRTR